MVYVIACKKCKKEFKVQKIIWVDASPYCIECYENREKDNDLCR